MFAIFKDKEFHAEIRDKFTFDEYINPEEFNHEFIKKLLI